MYIASLNSGSNGNCYYVGNNNEAVLVDAGLSCSETVKRMKRMGLKMDSVKAIFISHEHGDHIKGVEVLAGKFELPVYITTRTLQHSSIKRNRRYMVEFTAYQPVIIGALSVLAFPKFHDAADPHSFMISSNGINVGVFTDIGRNCEHVTAHFKQCHAAFLESNYDEAMLMNGRYPPHLKKRISGGEGHLSNKQALEIFMAHKPSFMTHLLLSHLSAENNTPELVHELFTAHAGNTNVVVASRKKESEVYAIHTNHKVAPKERKVAVKAEQISMF